MTDVDSSALLTIAADLATAAGAILRERALIGRTSVESKSSLVDVVTDADHASEAFIMNALRSQRPDDGLLGEEGTRFESKNGIDWVFDPLDGTTNFVYSIPFYAVSIGVTLHGVPVAGAVYNPALDELYTASTGAGAFCNGTRLQTNNITALESALVATGFSYSSADRANQGAVVLGLVSQVRDIRRCGSAALDACNVASGRVDAYFERGVQPWDVTAGAIIAREAGALVGALSGDRNPVPLSGDFIAAAPGIYDQLLAVVGD